MSAIIEPEIGPVLLIAGIILVIRHVRRQDGNMTEVTSEQCTHRFLRNQESSSARILFLFLNISFVPTTTSLSTFITKQTIGSKPQYPGQGKKDGLID